MMRINLLPWREQVKRNQKIYLAATIGVTIGISFFFLLIFHFCYLYKIHSQHSRNEFLKSALTIEQDNIASFKKEKLTLTSVEEKLNFIISLRKSSVDAVRLLNELATLVPNSISLTRLIRQGKTILIAGYTDSNISISAFMKNLTESPYFFQPTLTEIITKQVNLTENRVFQLKVEQKE